MLLILVIRIVVPHFLVCTLHRHLHELLYFRNQICWGFSLSYGNAGLYRRQGCACLSESISDADCDMVHTLFFTSGYAV